MCTSTYRHIHTHLYACTHPHAHTCTYRYIHMSTYVHTHAHTHPSLHAHVHTHTTCNAHAHTRLPLHIRAHTHLACTDPHTHAAFPEHLCTCTRAELQKHIYPSMYTQHARPSCYARTFTSTCVRTHMCTHTHAPRVTSPWDEPRHKQLSTSYQSLVSPAGRGTLQALWQHGQAAN